MTISKRELFKVWRDENVPAKRSSAVIAYVLAKTRFKDSENEENCKRFEQLFFFIVGQLQRPKSMLHV